jgi:hypothetical protein
VVLDTVPKTNECIIENGLLKAKQIGTGFMRIKRTAVEKLIKAFPRRYCPGDGGPHALHYALFDARICWPDSPDENGQFWGEDLEFCQKWVSLGEAIWIDPNVSMQHVGRKVHQGNFLNYLKSTCAVTMQEPEVKSIPQTLEAIEQIAA